MNILCIIPMVSNMNYNTLLNEIGGKDLWRLWLNYNFLHYSALHWITLLPRWQNQLGLKRAGETAEPKVKAWASGGRAALLLCMCCEQCLGCFTLCSEQYMLCCSAALHVHIVQWYTRCCLDAALLLWMQWTIYLMLYIFALQLLIYINRLQGRALLKLTSKKFKSQKKRLGQL